VTGLAKVPGFLDEDKVEAQTCAEDKAGKLTNFCTLCTLRTL
jgi:hypothetical protein